MSLRPVGSSVVLLRAGDSLLDPLEKLPVDKRFLDEVDGPCLQRRYGGGHITIAGQQDSRHLSPGAPHLLDQLDSASARQIDLADHTGNVILGQVTKHGFGVTE